MPDPAWKERNGKRASASVSDRADDADLRDEVQAAIDDAKAFFALPEEDKRAIEMINSPHFRGWTRLGGELTQGQVDYREQIDIGPEMPARTVVDPPYLRLDGPNQWPAALPQLRTVIEAWTERLGVIGRRLMSQWALALGAPADHFDATFDDASPKCPDNGSVRSKSTVTQPLSTAIRRNWRAIWTAPARARRARPH